MFCFFEISKLGNIGEKRAPFRTGCEYGNRYLASSFVAGDLNSKINMDIRKNMLVCVAKKTGNKYNERKETEVCSRKWRNPWKI